MGLLGVAGVFFMPVLLRYVSPGIMASVLVAQVWVYYLLLLIQFGFNWSSPAAYARACDLPERASIWRTANRVRLSLLTGLSALIFGIVFIAYELDTYYLFGFWLLLGATAVNSNWLLQARSDFFTGVVCAFLGVVVSAILVWLIVYRDIFAARSWLNGVSVICVLTFPAVFLGFGSWWMSRKIYGGCEPAAWRRQACNSDAQQLLQNLPLVATQFLQLVSATVGTVIVGSLSDAATTNAYAAMERLFNLVASVIVSFYMAAYPRLAASFYDSRHRYWQLVWYQLSMGGLFSLMMMGGFVFFGDSLLKLYVSDRLALSVAPVMMPFAAWIGLYLFQHVLSGYFVLLQRNGLVLAVNALVLFVTFFVGYLMASQDVVLWVYGMLAGQVVAVVWVFSLYYRDMRFLRSRRLDIPPPTVSK